MSAGLLLPYHHRWPKVAPNAFVAAGSSVIGDVVLGARSSVWFNCVLRGDVNRIHVGARSNVQDGTIIHTATADGPPRSLARTWWWGTCACSMPACWRTAA